MIEKHVNFYFHLVSKNSNQFMLMLIGSHSWNGNSAEREEGGPEDDEELESFTSYGSYLNM